jgi:hypothetical protein
MAIMAQSCGPSFGLPPPASIAPVFAYAGEESRAGGKGDGDVQALQDGSHGPGLAPRCESAQTRQNID